MLRKLNSSFDRGLVLYNCVMKFFCYIDYLWVEKNWITHAALKHFCVFPTLLKHSSHSGYVTSLLRNCRSELAEKYNFSCIVQKIWWWETILTACIYCLLYIIDSLQILVSKVLTQIYAIHFRYNDVSQVKTLILWGLVSVSGLLRWPEWWEKYPTSG